mgnify:CR=1 FL=1
MSRFAFIQISDHHLPEREDDLVRGFSPSYAFRATLRHIAWKQSAVLGRLQVKRYQPAIALDTTIFLNLNRSDYSQKRLWLASELAIVVAASLASSLVERRQAVGLGTNGRDPLADLTEDLAGSQKPVESSPVLHPPTMRPAKGRRSLMRILDLLARIEVADGIGFPTLLEREAANLTWGATLVVVTGRVTDELFQALAHLRRAGFSVVLIAVDSASTFRAVRERAARIGVPSYEVWEEPDLERWGLLTRREA